MRCRPLLLGAAAAAVAAAAAAVPAGVPAPQWPSPLPAFPSSWFGANMKSFEFEDPKELTQLKQYKQVLASWPELVLSSNFSNGTLIAVEDATRMKALLGPSTSVFTYQSMWVAAGFYDEVWPLMQDLEQYGGFFVRNADDTLATYTGYCSQVAQGGRVEVNATSFPRCLGYYWNWCNETAVDWYVTKVMHPMVADSDGKRYDYDGVFLDNSDNFRPPRGSKAQCDIANATLGVHIALGKMFTGTYSTTRRLAPPPPPMIGRSEKEKRA
jgi:hypothetical protein